MVLESEVVEGTEDGIDTVVIFVRQQSINQNQPPFPSAGLAWTADGLCSLSWVLLSSGPQQT